jgi:hypothetical protein
MTRGLTPGDFQELRSEPRTPCLRTIDVLPCQARDKWKFIPAELTDCSLHGLAVVVPEPIEAGQQFLVKLRLGGQIKLLIYTVQNCTPALRRFRVGARFTGFAAQEFDENAQIVFEALIKGGSSQMGE